MSSTPFIPLSRPFRRNREISYIRNPSLPGLLKNSRQLSTTRLKINQSKDLISILEMSFILIKPCSICRQVSR